MDNTSKFAFRRFQESRRFVLDLSKVDELDGCEVSGPGFFYNSGCVYAFIHEDGTFSTSLYSEEPMSRDLEDIEHALYEFLVREGAEL